MANLTIVRRPNPGRGGPVQPSVVAVTKDETLIGRDPPEQGIDLQLPEFTINRRHARVVRDQGVYWVEDLKSRNGTRLNGTPVAGRAPLREGDEIQIGGYVIRFNTD